MREITTVLGAITPDKLGFCQFHEHILISKGCSEKINSALCIDNLEKSLEELIRYKNAGGSSIIDAQPGGCNRMPLGLAELSKKSGVNIIASTGFHKLIFYPKDHWIHTASMEFLLNFFVNELNSGMYTDIDRIFNNNICKFKAGIIKTALDKVGLTRDYIRLFKAAALASQKTDKTIMIHIEKGSNPIELFQFLTFLGVCPSRLVFCHLDRACSDINTHKYLLKQGCFLEYDTIGRYKYHSDDFEIQLIKEILDSGYSQQLLYSLDTTRERLKSYEPPAIGLDYILKNFNGLMQIAGISEKQIYQISVLNCIKALT